MKRVLSGALALTALSVLLPTLASARPSYMMAFNKVYEVKPDSNLAKAKCGLCHQGATKAVRNTYGKALEAALGKEKATDEEITAAIKKADKEKTADKKTTFGALIKEDKLPGTEVK